MLPTARTKRLQEPASTPRPSRFSAKTTHNSRRYPVTTYCQRPNGVNLAEYERDSPPVFDGMAAALGKLYLSTSYGKLSALPVGR